MNESRLPNYAGRKDVDIPLEEELELAGIHVEHLPEGCRDTMGEVKSIVIGSLHGWTFTRNWYYWVCKGPGIPVDVAMKLHERYGSVVRVDGHCGCPSPLERFKGLGTGAYHVDSLRGLKALADTIREVVKAAEDFRVKEVATA